MHWARALLLGAVLAACGGAQRGGERGDAQLGPLIALVPPGPTWLVQARPRALAQQEAALSLWRALVTEEREAAFAERTGVAPREVDELVAFELPSEGYVMLVRGPFAARSVVVRAGARLAVPDVTSDAPLVRREGLTGQARYAYAALSERALLIAKNAPPTLVAEILARRSDPKAPRALEGPDARALLAEHAANPLLLLAPAPLAFDPGTQVSLLFARERALAVTVRPTHTSLGVGIDLRGEFPPGADRNFRALAQSLASAELGRALGLARVPERMAVRVDAQGAFVSFALEARDLLAGMRLLFFDEMRQLFSGLRSGRDGATCCAHGEDRGSFPGRRPGGVSGARRGRSGRDRVEGHRG
jgi:hypothetical protein